MSDGDTWEPRPVPDVTPETAPFWAGAADGRFLLRECTDCGLTFYYPRALCPDCFADGVEWVEASGRGTVYTYTYSEQVANWPDADLPLVVALVELSEGPRVPTAVVDADPDDVAVGTVVEVQFVPTEDEDLAIPVFAPSGTGD